MLSVGEIAGVCARFAAPRGGRVGAAEAARFHEHLCRRPQPSEEAQPVSARGAAKKGAVATRATKQADAGSPRSAGSADAVPTAPGGGATLCASSGVTFADFLEAVLVHEDALQRTANAANAAAAKGPKKVGALTATAAAATQ